MIRHFALHDILLLAQLQKEHTSLCPIEALIRPQSPMWAAVTSLLPLGEARLSTFVLSEARGDGKRLQGFVQVEVPPTRPEIHIQNLSPSLDDRKDTWEDARTVWIRLLNHVVAVAGELGLQRVFACAGEGGEALDLLRSAGFSVYTREEIYCLAPDTHPQAIAQVGIRPEQSADAWALDQLYRQTVPHLVQQAEAPPEGKSMGILCGPVAWEQGEGFVLEDGAGIAGYGHLMSGRIGHWLTVIVHQRAYDQVEKLLDYGLALLNYYPPHPVYCAVRGYQGGVRAPLQDRGFQPVSLQCRLVKHTMARVKEPARVLVPALEKRPEASTPTASRTEALEVTGAGREYVQS